MRPPVAVLDEVESDDELDRALDARIRQIVKVEVAKAIRKLRPEADLTQQQAAERLGVSRDTLRRWEQRGVLVPRRVGSGRPRYNAEVINAILHGDGLGPRRGRRG